MNTENLLLTPDWQAPDNIRAYSTLCGQHAEFDIRTQENRQILKTLAHLPATPAWLRQTHGTKVVHANSSEDADASFTDIPGQVCVVMTADCLPVLLCDRNGTKVAVVHAGWRGLAAGILENTVQTAGFRADQTLAWLGPAIGPNHFEVGNEVREQFLARWPECTHAFCPSPQGRWLANLYALAQHALATQGIHEISGGNHCTFQESQLFFSYRRKKDAGRMATLIWMT